MQINRNNLANNPESARSIQYSEEGDKKRNFASSGTLTVNPFDVLDEVDQQSDSVAFVY